MTQEKSLDITSIADAKARVSDIKVFGNGDLFELMSKASSKEQGWMKSTKCLQIVGAGCVVQVTTQQGDHVAEALTFVPGVRIEEYDYSVGLEAPVKHKRLVVDYSGRIQGEISHLESDAMTDLRALFGMFGVETTAEAIRKIQARRPRRLHPKSHEHRQKSKEKTTEKDMSYIFKAVAVIATFFGIAWQSVRLTLYVGSLIPAGDYQQLLKVVWYIASVPLLGGVTLAGSLIAAFLVAKLIGADKH